MCVKRPLLPLIGTAVVLTACSGVLGPNGERRLGVIAFYGDPVVTEVPDTVQVGVVLRCPSERTGEDASARTAQMCRWKIWS